MSVYWSVNTLLVMLCTSQSLILVSITYILVIPCTISSVFIVVICYKRVSLNWLDTPYILVMSAAAQRGWLLDLESCITQLDCYLLSVSYCLPTVIENIENS